MDDVQLAMIDGRCPMCAEKNLKGHVLIDGDMHKACSDLIIARNDASECYQCGAKLGNRDYEVCERCKAAAGDANKLLKIRRQNGYLDLKHVFNETE